MYSKFPDFVYSWFNKFKINEITRQVESINEQFTQKTANRDTVDHKRAEFLKYLAHPMMDKHWESATFRQV